jgi:hypothetical protein
VTYDRDKQKQLAMAIFGRIASVVEQYEQKHGRPDAATPGLAGNVRTAYLSEIIRLRAGFKPPAFRAEEEWRIVQFSHPVVDDPPVRFRPSFDAVKPYVELDLGANILPIEQVMIGPAMKPELSRRSAMLILAKNGYSNVDVRSSTVPFRL